MKINSFLYKIMDLRERLLLPRITIPSSTISWIRQNVGNPGYSKSKFKVAIAGAVEDNVALQNDM